jgi:hypothetical protein
LNGYISKKGARRLDIKTTPRNARNGNANFGNLPPLNKYGTNHKIARKSSGTPANGLTGASPVNLAISGELVIGIVTKRRIQKNHDVASRDFLTRVERILLRVMIFDPDLSH